MADVSASGVERQDPVARLRQLHALSRSRAAAAVLLTSALTLGPASPAPAAAPTERFVLTLASSQPVATPQRPPASRAERLARAAARRPSTASRRTTVQWLETRGYEIERATAWTITALGPQLTSKPPGTSAVTRDAPARLRPRAVPVGYGPEEIRDAYAATGNGTGTTVATVQFSGWRANDASVYADAAGVPLRQGQITSVSVAGARTDVPDGLGGDVEVSLDVESIVATAPAARQRVFVAPNSNAGVVAVWDAVADEAERTGLVAVSTSWGACEEATAPDVIAAVEVSLERLVDAGTTVLAASGDSGAFDCGYADAPDDHLAVDYPAASPRVVAVGGTTLERIGDGWAERAWSDRSLAREGFPGEATGGGLSVVFPRPDYQRGVVTEDRRALPDLAVVADPRTGIGVYGPLGGGRRGWGVSGGTSASSPLTAGLLASAVSAAGRTLGLGRVHVGLYAAARDTPGAFRDVTAGDNLYYPARVGYDLATGLGTPQWSVLGPRLLRPALSFPDVTASRALTASVYVPTSRTATYALAEGATCDTPTDPQVPTEVTVAEGPDRVLDLVLVVRDGSGCTTTSARSLLDRTAPVARASLGRTSRPRVLAVGWGGTDPAPASGVARVSWRLLRTSGSTSATSSGGTVVARGLATRAGSQLRTVGAGTYVVEAFARDRAGTLSAPTRSAPVTVP